jgi:hypothetical protein
MSENKNFSLGGFPPIYEIISNIKKKEYVPNNILSIQSILSKREVKNDESNNVDEYKSSEKKVGKKRSNTNKKKISKK